MTKKISFSYFSKTTLHLGGALLNIPCLTGMSFLIKREAVNKFGGLDCLEKYLAEDFYMCKFLTEKGYKLKISSYSTLQNPEEPSSFHPFSERMKRWMKLRKSMIYFLVVIEPFIECLPSGLYGPLVLKFLFSHLGPYFPIFNMFSTNFSVLAAMVIHYLLWFVSDLIQTCFLVDNILDVFQLEFLVSWVLRHLIFLKLYVKILLMQRGDVVISWCDQRYVLRNGLLTVAGSPEQADCAKQSVDPDEAPLPLTKPRSDSCPGKVNKSFQELHMNEHPQIPTLNHQNSRHSLMSHSFTHFSENTSGFHSQATDSVSPLDFQISKKASKSRLNIHKSKGHRRHKSTDFIPR